MEFIELMEFWEFIGFLALIGFWAFQPAVFQPQPKNATLQPCNPATLQLYKLHQRHKLYQLFYRR